MNRLSHYLKQKNKKGQNGGILILIALSLVLFTVLAALTIDLGYLFAGRNQLQNAADAAALGAARKLGNIYQIMANEGKNLYGYNVDNADGDKAAIILAGKVVASQNKATNEGIIIDETQGDILIGVWDQDADPSFTETDDQPNAVKVTARRDTKDINTATDEIATFFSGVSGSDSFPVRADAIASLSPQGSSDPGELELPIGLSERWFYDDLGNPRDFCGDIVKFSPPTDPDACAGWTSFDQKVANKNPINDILDGTYISNASDVGDLFKYTNGVAVSDLFKNLLMKFGTYPNPDRAYDVMSIYNRDTPDILPEKVVSDLDRVPLCLYADVVQPCEPGDVREDTDPYHVDEVHLRYPAQGDPGNAGKFTGALRYAREWETTVVVYSADNPNTEAYDPDLIGNSSCNPSGDLAIEGYVKVVLYDVGAPSNPYVFARVSCDEASPGPTRGGGGKYYGVIGTIPQLVE